MRVSRINVQQTLLMLNHKKSTEEIEREIEFRSNASTNQISIFNSTFDRHILPKLNEEIEVLIVRKCKIVSVLAIQVFGKNLKTVELPYCLLKELPIINSEFLLKLNVSNNEICQILSIPNKSLRLLDIRNNRISKISREIHNPNLTVLHEFISKKYNKSLLSLPVCLYPPVIEMKAIIGESIQEWGKAELIEICESLIENGNEVLLSQLLPYLSEQFIYKIFEISKLKRKHSIIETLINSQQDFKLTTEEAINLLMPKYIQANQLFKINLTSLITSISIFNSQRDRVNAFLDYLLSIQQGRNLFIQSEKDLINFMSLNVSHSNSYEVDFLLTQFNFFDGYDFSNKAILQYLIQFDNLKLLQRLVDLPLFREKMFALGLYKKLMKPNKKNYKFLLKEDKAYQVMLNCKSELYFPEYRERKSFCLKNDLYDYQILSEYEQMQCSYSHKDLKFTFKFCNKENEISVAKRIETQLKRKKLKTMQIGKSNYSTNISAYNI